MTLPHDAIDNLQHAQREEPDPYPGWIRDLPDPDYDAMWESRYLEEWCNECQHDAPVDEVFEDQIGFEEQARPVVVTRLVCGHEIVRPGRWEQP